MRSDLFFKVKKDGSLSKVLTNDDKIYAGQVGTVYYRLSADNAEVDLLPSDVVFICFERGQEKAQQLMHRSTGTGEDFWELTSNGWESDVIVESGTVDLKVSFAIRRYSNGTPSRLVKTTPTGTYIAKIYPSKGYSPLDIADDDSEQILQEIGLLSATLGEHSTWIDDTTNANPMVDWYVDTETGQGVKVYLDNTTITIDIPSGGGCLIDGDQRLSTITFTEQAWADTGGGRYSLVFDSTMIGKSNNRYIVVVEELTNTNQYMQISDMVAVVKGSNGDLYVSTGQLFEGRLLIIGDMAEYEDFDLIINTQAEFDNMLASVNWLGAKRILLTDYFLHGSTISNINGAINVPDSVEKIAGLEGRRCGFKCINVKKTTASYSRGINLTTAAKTELVNLTLEIVGANDDINTTLYGISGNSENSVIKGCSLDVKAGSGHNVLYWTFEDGLTVKDCLFTVTSGATFVGIFGGVRCHIISDCTLYPPVNANINYAQSRVVRALVQGRGVIYNIRIPTVNGGYATAYEVVGATNAKPLDYDTCDWILPMQAEVVLRVGDWIYGEQEKTVAGLAITDNPVIVWDNVSDDEFTAFGQAMIRVSHEGDKLMFKALAGAPNIDITLTVDITRK